MANEIGVLVFPAGEINAIEVHDALCSTVNVRLVGAASVERHGRYVFRNYVSGLPTIDAPDFLPAFNALLEAQRIDVVFPTHDTVAEYLTAHRDQVKARIVGGTPETARVCRDKALTYATFADCDFCPRVFASPAEAKAFPVFVKPRKGQGSRGARSCATREELDAVDFAEMVVAEYLPGEELTVDCLTDGEGKLKVVSPRLRERVMGGVSVGGRTVERTPEIERIAAVLNERLRFLGLWYFQVKRDAAGRLKLLEVSARCAGSMCITRARGLNLPLLSVYACMGYAIEALPNAYSVTADRTLISRYQIDCDYDTVYLDYDDTLVVRNEVNTELMRFLYQCRNQGKSLVLLTRHAGDLRADLERRAIHAGLFAKIVHLDAEEPKVKHIRPGRAVFVDNAFKERASVAAGCGIPVFDVDGIEVLLDWRR